MAKIVRATCSTSTATGPIPLTPRRSSTCTEAGSDGGARTGKRGRSCTTSPAKAGTCISANYHLTPTPADGFPQPLIDVKKVIAWVRAHGHQHGAAPDTIVLAGSSAGAHLTAMAALTANDPMFQPGFEADDTTIIAGIGLYGYYGLLGGDEEPPTTPLAYRGPHIPPFFVVHGDHDTYTPVEGARALVKHLRTVSSSAVVYAELPGAQHSFDLFHSVRFETVIDAIEAFAGWVRSQHRPPTPVRHATHALTASDTAAGAS
jgi:acetyl esterase/lipase